MKVFILFGLCIVAVSANSLSKLRYGSQKTKDVVRDCLTSYNLSEGLMRIEDDGSKTMYEKLTEEQQGCVTACIYKGFGWLRADGTMNVDILFEPEEDDDDDDKAEAAREKVKYMKDIDDCRAEVGRNDCKFFHCLEKKG